MTYKIEESNLKILLDEVDEAVAMLEVFSAYSYSINIKRVGDIWKAKIRVNYGKKNRRGSQRFIESS